MYQSYTGHWANCSSKNSLGPSLCGASSGGDSHLLCSWRDFVHEMICCVLSYVLSSAIAKWFVDSRKGLGMERILTSFAHWNYWEHFHSNIPELFGAAFKLCFPNAHHHEIIHLSNHFLKRLRCSSFYNLHSQFDLTSHLSGSSITYKLSNALIVSIIVSLIRGLLKD